MHIKLKQSCLHERKTSQWSVVVTYLSKEWKPQAFIRLNSSTYNVLSSVRWGWLDSNAVKASFSSQKIPQKESEQGNSPLFVLFVLCSLLMTIKAAYDTLQKKESDTLNRISSQSGALTESKVTPKKNGK